MASLGDTVQTDQAAGTYYGAPVMQPYMPGAGWLEPTHQGIDIGLGPNAVVALPVEGTFQAQYSSPYNSVFKMANGLYEDFLHIVGFQFNDQQDVPAGSSIGYVDPRSNVSNLYSTTYAGAQVGPFFSTAPHVHIGEYSDPNQASNAYGSTTIDPINLFQGGSTAPPTTTPTPTPDTPATPKPQPNPPPIAGQLTPPNAPQTPQQSNIWGSDVSILGQDTGINLKKIGVEISAVLIAVVLLIAGALLVKQS